MFTLLLSFIKPSISVRQAIYVFNKYNFSRKKIHIPFKKTGIKIDKTCRINRPLYIDNPNIEIGSGVFINSGCVIISSGGINIGDNVFIAPGVKICTTSHSLDPIERKNGVCSARSITIGNNVWIGAGAIILPGVTISDNCVIGAGSVVSKSTEPNSLYVGNPAILKRKIDTVCVTTHCNTAPSV
jgi:maltose O-acetyltransferase